MRLLVRFQNVTGWVLAAAMLAAGYGYARAWPLAVLGASVFLWRAWRADRTRDSFFGGWLAGAIFFAFVTRWLFAVWPAEWLGLERDPAVLPLIFMSWLALAVSVSIVTGFVGIVAFRFRRLPAEWALVVLPSAWTLSEYLRAWLFSIVSWGPGALVGPHWTFGHLGYALVDSPFFRLAPVVGVYGLSWLIVFCAAMVVLVGRAYRMGDGGSRGRTLAACTAFLIVAMVGIAVADRHEAARPLSIVVVQSDTRQGPRYREAMGDAISAFFRTYPEVEPDVVVLPEDAQLFAIREEEERELLGKFFPDARRQGMVVTNATVVENGRRVKYTLYVDRGGVLVGRQPKTFLIPGGEIMPAVVAGMLRLTGRDDFISIFRERRLMSAAPLELKFVAFGTTKLSAAVCSGVITPNMYRELARSGAEILINQTSFSVFHGSPILLTEMTRLARFRAAENARPLVQSANVGYSMVVDADGTIIAQPAALGNDLIAAVVVPRRVTTPTQRFGDWPVEVSAIMLAAAFVCCRGRNRASLSGLEIQRSLH